jgi:DNA-binding NarL/FixJ family response regulator
MGLLSNEPDFVVAGQCGDGLAAVESAGQLQPDVMLMDVSMPKLDGIEATRLIKSRWPGIKVIGLSMHNEIMGSRTMREAGAEAYVHKTQAPAQLIDTIRAVASQAGPSGSSF